ncbi:MAG: serine/threonine-protein kinase [Pseudomonadota bacterium]
MTGKCPHCGKQHSWGIAACPLTRKELEKGFGMVGRTINQYEIQRLIGEGGMGAVFEAKHSSIGRKVALKFLTPQLAGDQEVLDRFFREARAAGQIGHENIIEIFDIGQDPESGAPYLVMEILQGQNLQDFINDAGSLQVAQAADIMLQVLSALGASHALGIFHRDMKPGNIFLTTRAGKKNWVKLLDFGIAKIKQPAEKGLTATGQMMGTPWFMAPEQIQDMSTSDHRVDLYACGVILYQCLTGRVPFDAPSIPGLLVSIMSQAPPDPRSIRPELSPDLTQVILKAMARDPGQRYQSAAEMADALMPYGTGNLGIAMAETMPASAAPGPAPATPAPSAAPATPVPVEALPTPSTDLQWKRSMDSARAREKSGPGKVLVIGGVLVAFLLVVAVLGVLAAAVISYRNKLPPPPREAILPKAPFKPPFPAPAPVPPPEPFKKVEKPVPEEPLEPPVEPEKKKSSSDAKNKKSQQDKKLKATVKKELNATMLKKSLSRIEKNCKDNIAQIKSKPNLTADQKAQIIKQIKHGCELAAKEARETWGEKKE